jgi:hypothetical protein
VSFSAERGGRPAKRMVFDTERLLECQGQMPVEMVSVLDAIEQFV